MIRNIRFRTGFLVLLVGLAVPGADAQAPLQMVVNADQGKTTINRHIYGHFSEHLGRMIYDGVWTKAGTGQWHLRDDVIEALRLHDSHAGLGARRAVRHDDLLDERGQVGA